MLRASLLAIALASLSSAASVPAARAPAADPCAQFAGQAFVKPALALACLKSFPFNETLRQNVLANINGVFDFFTFEDFYLNSPPPFQESTANIRQKIAQINRTHFAVSLKGSSTFLR